jgi:hypothetical protein
MDGAAAYRRGVVITVTTLTVLVYSSSSLVNLRFRLVMVVMGLYKGWDVVMKNWALVRLGRKIA